MRSAAFFLASMILFGASLVVSVVLVLLKSSSLGSWPLILGGWATLLVGLYRAKKERA